MSVNSVREALELARRYIEGVNVETDGEVGKNDEGEVERWIYLGQLINPSSKFYTPFAHSNVELCPHCHGSGSWTNPRANDRIATALEMAANALRLAEIAEFGPYFEGKWPQSLQDCISNLYKSRLRYDNQLTCPWCGGEGSREAYLDGRFEEALEALAGELGGYITSGEGDCSDRFLVIPQDSSEGDGNEDTEADNE